MRKFKARASHAAQVQSRVKKLDKIERVEAPRRRQSVQFEFRSPPRSGDDVISLRDVHKGYGAQPIYEGLDFLVRRKGTLVRPGRQRRRQVDAAETGGRRRRARPKEKGSEEKGSESFINRADARGCRPGALQDPSRCLAQVASSSPARRIISSSAVTIARRSSSRMPAGLLPVGAGRGASGSWVRPPRLCADDRPRSPADHA